MVLERIGEFVAAGDLTTAANIRQPGTASQRAVDERVPVVAADLILDNSAEIAEAAAVLAQSDVGLARRDDPGMPRAHEDEQLAYQVVDSDGRRFWLEAVGTDGGPSDWATFLMRDRLRMVERSAGEYLFAVEGKDGRLTDLAIRRSDGQFADFVIDRLRDRLGSAVASRVYADVPWSPGMRVGPVSPRLTRLAGWGSSTMSGLATPLGAYAVSKGATYFNGGYSGRLGFDAAAHQGSVPYLINDTVLAGGDAVAVTGSWLNQYNPFTLAGTVAGVHGILAKAAGSAAPMTFTPTSPSTAAIGGPIIPDRVIDRDAVQIFNPFKNDLAQNIGVWGTVQEAIDVTHRMIEFQVARDAEFRVLTHFFDQDLPVVSAVRDRIEAWNEAMITAYGALTLRMDAYVGSEQIYTDLGLTPTSEDLAQIALGNKGPSISTDLLHLTAPALAAVVNSLIAPSLDPVYS